MKKNFFLGGFQSHNKQFTNKIEMAQNVDKCIL